MEGRTEATCGEFLGHNSLHLFKLGLEDMLGAIETKQDDPVALIQLLLDLLDPPVRDRPFTVPPFRALANPDCLAYDVGYPSCMRNGPITAQSPEHFDDGLHILEVGHIESHGHVSLRLHRQMDAHLGDDGEVALYE